MQHVSHVDGTNRLLATVQYGWPFYI